MAAHVVPPVPLDWNVAQTQATIAFTLADELDAALAARGLSQRTAGLVTRTLVDADDPHFREPSKPVGRFLPREEAERFVSDRKSTRLNSSHANISYAVFCLKKKKN